MAGTHWPGKTPSRKNGAPTAEGGHSFRTLGQNLKRIVVRRLDYIEHQLSDTFS